MTTARQIVRQVTGRVAPGYGCSDGNCVFGNRGGMQTNGGCQCLKGDRDELRRTVLSLSRVAHELAAMLPEIKP